MLALVFAAMLPILPADQAVPQAAQVGPLLPARSFSHLFSVPLPKTDGKQTVVVETPQPRAKKKVICGTTVIIVDGRVDPKMAIAPTGGRDVDPAMPRVPKPMCGEKEK